MGKARSKQEIIDASEHVCYEIQMLDQVGRALAFGFSGIGPLHNALINSFAIHTRNLIDFLYKSKTNANNDVIVAEHYFKDSDQWKSLRPDITPFLKKAKIRCDKQVAHLTFTRQKKEGWDFAGIANELFKVISIFLDNIDHDLLGNHYKQINYIFPERFHDRK